MEKTEKVSSRDILGYILIFLGIGIIVAVLVNGYFLFSKKAKPVDLFALPAISIDLTKAMTASLPVEVQKLQKPGSASADEIISAETVNAPLNLFTHLFFLGFFATIGGRLALIGVDMTRPYVYKEKSIKSL